MAHSPQSARVYLVGAGPGDPGLLTLRAVECLQQADFILYDYLTSTRTLDYARPEAERFRVTQLPGTHAERWQHILDKIIAEYRAGKVVVHLKGGDPLMFGRGAEEAEALRAAGIPYEIVPGVTSALAAAAYAEIPLTHRTCASAVTFVTGHEDPDKEAASLDWNNLAKLPGTLVIYMGMTQLGHIVKELVSHGRDSRTPAALVHRASSGAQMSIVATLGSIEEEVRRSNVGRPSLVIIGPAVGLRPDQSWFEARPLLGMRVVITRPSEQAIGFARQLELLGAIPEVLPAIEIRQPKDWSTVDRAIKRLALDGFDWVVFTSANAVTAFMTRLFHQKKDMRAFARSSIACIGPATAASLSVHNLTTDLVAGSELNSEDLAAQLLDRCRGQRILLPRAAQGRERLRELLAEVATVDAVVVYEQADAVELSSDVLHRLRGGNIDVVTLTSPNIAEAFLNACDDDIVEHFSSGKVALLANSNRLVDLLAQKGLSARLSPDPTESGLTAGLIEIATSRPGRR